MGARREHAAIRGHCRHKTRHRVKRRHQTTLVVALVAMMFAVLGPVCSATGSFTTQGSDTAFIAGSELQAWWGQRGDVENAMEQLGGVQRCPEGVNARLDSELMEDALLTSCRQDAADFDLAEMLQAGEMQIPTREQMTRICLSESCAAWLAQAAQAEWLPECRYRQSQTSLRSLAEILIRIREDLTLAGEQAVVVAPNASVFRELYQINQLVNLLNEKDGPNETDTPVMQVARQLSPQTDFESVGSGESTGLSNAVAASSSGSANPPSDPSTAGSSASPSNPETSSTSSSLSSSGSSSTSSSFSATGSSQSIGDDWLSNSSLNATDNAGFTGSGIGPHANTTATTTELGPSYAFLVGAWILFNGSYFFLMRKK